MFALKKKYKQKVCGFPFLIIKWEKIALLHDFEVTKVIIRVKSWLGRSRENIWDAEYRKWIWSIKSRTNLRHV